jgi:UDPglucose 6-dehydrogenase
MKLSIIGTGYVGLVTGACLADVGNDVLCIDTDADKVKRLRAGEVPIFEPGLDAIVQRNVEAGRLRFGTSPAEGAEFAALQFIAVGTPPGEDGSADLNHVLTAARTIGRYMTETKVIVDKSTVPVGTADLVREAIADELRRRGMDGLGFQVVSNPEFLKEGAAIKDFMRPDRVVIGCDDERARATMRDLYAPFVRSHDRILMMDVRSAELTKYAANAMLATRISFMNELAALAEAVGADIESVREGLGTDTRIGLSFLYAGCGYGGSCFPKDVQALLRTAEGKGVELGVVRAVERANEAQKRVLTAKIKARLGADLSGRRFALWGLAFKPDTDDMREAPSLSVMPALVEAGASVCAYDPVATGAARTLLQGFPRVEFAASAELACDGADALVIVTEWKEFRSPDFDDWTPSRASCEPRWTGPPRRTPRCALS